ncbi:hypothetical protein ACFOU2_22220 [Bacillus songklensis]|uniref:Uncharacterized protein n=1 Tax=Bacillus songklensis TaxID=1069116 RepID=A0ABV8B814_9BACI
MEFDYEEYGEVDHIVITDKDNKVLVYISDGEVIVFDDLQVFFGDGRFVEKNGITKFFKRDSFILE